MRYVGNTRGEIDNMIARHRLQRDLATDTEEIAVIDEWINFLLERRGDDHE